MNDQPEGASSSSPLGLSDLWAIVQMQQRVVLAATIVGVLLAALYSIVATRYYRSTVVVHLSTMAGQEIETERVVDFDQYHRWNRHMFVRTQLEILQSRKMLTRVLQTYTEANPESELRPDSDGVRAFASMIEVKARQGTELVDLSVTSPDPDMSAQLAQILAETYQQSNLDAVTEAAQSAKEWLEQQLVDKARQIADASKELRGFQRDNDMADAEEEVTPLSARMDSLNLAYGKANTDRVLLETTVRNHRRLLEKGEFDELAKDMSTPLMVSLMQDKARAATEQARVAAVYGERMPQRQSADAELERIDTELQLEIRRTLQAEEAQLAILKNKEANLEREISRGKDDLLNLSANKQEYHKKRLALERAQEFYRRLGQRRDELDLQAKTRLNNVRIVQDARREPTPVEPRLLLNLGIGLIGGLLLGLSGALLREYMDDTISSPLEVQTFLKVPFLGMVPKIEEINDETDLALYAHENPRSNVAEAIRATRTVLDLSPSVQEIRRLLVTSAVSAEGKTSTVVRLGVAYADLGRRVLMIDADLRRPRVHRIFGHDRKPGFTSLVSGERTIEETVRQTGIDNLWYLPSGRGGERPNELLAHPDVVRVLEQLEEHFDLIIIDSPPSVLLSDARVLSRYVDGVVVLVREHATPRVLIREAIEGLEQVGANVLGVVVNAVDLARRRTSYKYYYGYGYRYAAYGYPASDEDEDNEDHDDFAPVERALGDVDDAYEDRDTDVAEE